MGHTCEGLPFLVGCEFVTKSAGDYHLLSSLIEFVHFGAR